MAPDKRQRAIQRVRGLRAKTVERGASPQEAESAARMADKLVEEYGLTEADIEPPQPVQPPQWPQGGGFPSEVVASAYKPDAGLAEMLARFSGILGVKYVEHKTGVNARAKANEVYEEMAKACKSDEERRTLQYLHQQVLDFLDNPFGRRKK
jgi:hypothetical protein